MKKNWAMRAAILMVALTLITSCFVSGTFAKYVTSGNGTDIARVAKFGVTVTATGDTFDTEYETHDNTFTLADNTVVSSNTDNLVAPGTNHDVAVVTLAGTPEVAVRVAYEATIELSGWTLDGTTEYCPIVFTVGGTDYSWDEGNETVAEFAARVETAIEDCSADYEALTNLATAQGTDCAIAWEWPFETGADAAAIAANDIKDTTLGNNAANGTAAVISITLTATVTQID